jgi:hypothetical protein
MKRAGRQTPILALVLVALLLSGCAFSFYGRTDSGAEVQADYGARYEESGDGRQTTGIRHGDFDPN